MALAARGARNMDNGPEKITDPKTLAQVRRQAARGYIKSIALGLALTLVVFILPA